MQGCKACRDTIMTLTCHRHLFFFFWESTPFRCASSLTLSDPQLVTVAGQDALSAVLLQGERRLPNAYHVVSCCGQGQQRGLAEQKHPARGDADRRGLDARRAGGFLTLHFSLLRARASLRLLSLYLLSYFFSLFCPFSPFFPLGSHSCCTRVQTFFGVDNREFATALRSLPCYLPCFLCMFVARMRVELML